MRLSFPKDTILDVLGGVFLIMSLLVFMCSEYIFSWGEGGVIAGHRRAATLFYSMALLLVPVTIRRVRRRKEDYNGLWVLTVVLTVFFLIFAFLETARVLGWLS